MTNLAALLLAVTILPWWPDGALLLGAERRDILEQTGCMKRVISGSITAWLDRDTCAKRAWHFDESAADPNVGWCNPWEFVSFDCSDWDSYVGVGEIRFMEVP